MPAPAPFSLQAFPPAVAHQCLQVEQFITQTLQVSLQGQCVVVACSGGVDSMALLAILHALSVRGVFSLVAGHLDHGLREDSPKDAALVRSFCLQLSIPYHCERVDVGEMAANTRKGIEEAGRLARQRFLEALRLDCDAAWIATGHQLNDLAEDQLMRQLRGAGWPALGGMAGAVEPGATGKASPPVIRPLLLTPKASLLECAAALRVPYRNDPSNADLRFLRNRIRHTILPLLLQENPSYLEQVAGQWRMARMDDEYFSQVVGEVLGLADRQIASLRLPRAAVASLHIAIRLRCFKAALESLVAGAPQMETLFQLEHAEAAGRAGCVFQFSGGVTASLQQDSILFAIEPTCVYTSLRTNSH